MNSSASVKQPPSAMSPAKSSAFEPKLAHPIEHPFQVVCQLCQKTIGYSSKGGEITYAVCDECSGI